MDWFNIAKRYFDLGIYGTNEVGRFVVRGKITETQYEEITKEAYVTQE